MAATVATLRAYMRDGAARWSDADLQGVLYAEAGQQTARLQPGALDLPDVVEALHRRCVVNLARRPLPLGVTDATGDAGDRTYLPSADPEVRRLEAPYRKLTVG